MGWCVWGILKENIHVGHPVVVGAMPVMCDGVDAVVVVGRLADEHVCVRVVAWIVMA